MLAPSRLPASSWLEWGFWWGQHCGGPSVLLSEPLLWPWSPAGLEGSCVVTGGPVQG